MSIRDATAILNEDSALFAFLPVANLVFLTIKHNTRFLLLVSIGVSALAALLYNVIRGKPSLSSRSRVGFTLIGGLWIVALLYSMWGLRGIFGERTVLPEMLFFVSAGFLFLLLTDLVARATLAEYDSQL